MARHERYRRDRYDEDFDRDRAFADDEYRRYVNENLYAPSEYAGGHYDYGFGPEDVRSGRRGWGTESGRRYRARSRRASWPESEAYNSASEAYGESAYGGPTYGRSSSHNQYLGGGTYGAGGVEGYGQTSYPERNFNRGFGAENPPMGGRFRHFGEERPRYGQRNMWDRATDEVSSWFGDEDAEARRRQDQFRGRGPKNYTRSSERIREDVCDRLSDDWDLDASDIEVSVSGTEVTLDGTVSSRDSKRRAEDCVDSVSGVTHVQNNLRVSSTEDGLEGTPA